MQEISRDIPKKQNEFKITPTKLFEHYSDMVWRLALTRVGSSSSADDVLQEVFLRVVKINPAFKNSEHAKAWLIKVTINCSKKLMGSAFRRHQASLEDNIAFETMEERDVSYAVQALNHKYKTVVHLYYYEGLKIDEIAEILQISPSAVKQRLSRAREQLKQYMTGDEDIV